MLSNPKFQKQLRKGWSILVGLVVVSLLLSGCGGTAAASKVYHVGVLAGLNFVSAITDGLKAKMTELGYVEGKNIVYDVQATDFDLD